MTRRRTGSATFQILPRRYLIDDGVGPAKYFGTPGHETRAAAEAQWRTCRRATWAECFRFTIPHGATAYDGFTRTAWELCWSACQHWPEAAAGVPAFVAEDLTAVDRFVETDPEGADQIADFLTLWREDLATIRRVAEAIAADPESRRGGYSKQITGGGHYGDALGEE